jgi:inner membrane protein involved in colicin E2 resistance
MIITLERHPLLVLAVVLTITSGQQDTTVQEKVLFRQAIMPLVLVRKINVMAEERTPRTLTLDLNPMTDAEYKQFKQWIDEALYQMKYANETAILTIPKVVLKMEPIKGARIYTTKPQLVKPINSSINQKIKQL